MSELSTLRSPKQRDLRILLSGHDVDSSWLLQYLPRRLPPLVSPQTSYIFLHPRACLFCFSGRVAGVVGCGASASSVFCAIQTGCPLWPPPQHCSLKAPRFIKLSKQSVRPRVFQGTLFIFFPTPTQKESSQRVEWHLVDITILYFEIEKYVPSYFFKCQGKHFFFLFQKVERAQKAKYHRVLFSSLHCILFVYKMLSWGKCYILAIS